MRRFGLVSILIVLLVLIISVVFGFTVRAQQTFDRRFTWNFNSTLSCPGGISCHQAGNGVLTSQDLTIPTSGTHFEFSLLELSCSVDNRGPGEAQFDTGVLFGPNPTVMWPAGSEPEQAQGTYRGAAYDLAANGSGNPNWFVNFQTRDTGTGGPPVLSENWLIPGGNVFDGTGIVHLMIAVSSGSSSMFVLFVSTCYLHVAFVASNPTQAQQTTASVGQAPLNFAYATIAVIVFVWVGITVLRNRSKRIKQRKKESNHRPEWSATEILDMWPEKFSILVAATLAAIVLIGLYVNLWTIGAISGDVLGLIVAGMGGVLVWGYKRAIARMVKGQLGELANEAIQPQSSTEDKLLPILRGFVIRWEQYISQGNQRWLGPTLNSIQQHAIATAEALTDLVADGQDNLPPPLITDINELVKDLRQFGNYQIYTIGTSDIQIMDNIGKAAFERARGLIGEFTE